MARPIDQLEITARFGGRGIVAHTTLDGRRYSAQSTKGFLSAAAKLVAMVVFGSCQKNFIIAAEGEYEINHVGNALPEHYYRAVRKKGF